MQTATYLYYMAFFDLYNKLMEEYIRDRAKHKAIAVYTFKSINCDGSTAIGGSKLRECLLLTLQHFNKNIELEEVEKIINAVDKLQKNVF